MEIVICPSSLDTRDAANSSMDTMLKSSHVLYKEAMRVHEEIDLFAY